MSDKTKQNILSWGALSALCACMMCLLAITRAAWTDAEYDKLVRTAQSISV